MSETERTELETKALAAARQAADDHVTMKTDLLMSRLHHDQEAETIVVRAQLYVNAGLPLAAVLDALDLSRSSWYRRVAEVDAARKARVVAYEERHSAETSHHDV